MELKNGLYEQVINRIISDNVNKLKGQKLIDKEKIDEAESSTILAQYLAGIIKKGLSYGDKDEDSRIARQVSICNSIVEILLNETGEDSLKDYMITGDAEVLLAILDSINTDHRLMDNKKIIRPTTPLSQSSLFKGSLAEPSLVSELKKEILTADRIDMLMSFIKWSGLRIITCSCPYRLSTRKSSKKAPHRIFMTS